MWLILATGCELSAVQVDAGLPDASLPDDAGRRADGGTSNDAGVERFLELALQDHDAIDAYLEEQMEQLGLVGLAAAVVEGQSIRYLKAFGFENREADIPADPRRTVWRLASLSKGVTGVIATRLAGRGEIDLEAPLPDLQPEFAQPARYLPPFCNEHSCSRRLPDDAVAITLDLLLHHRSGIVHYTNGVGDPSPPQELANDAATNSGLRWALSYLSDQPLMAQPGARFAYSSFGYNLAGAALEERAGQSYDSLLRSEVSNPAEAPSLQVERLWEPLPHAAVPYRIWGQGMEADIRHDVSWKAPGGGLVATVEDMARYCGALLHRRLTGQQRDRMLWSPAPDDAYAHGFLRDPQTGAIGHNGAQQGARTGLLLLPDSMRCFVVMTNTEMGDGSTWTDALAEIWD